MMVLFPCLINCISLSFLEAKIMSDFRILLIYKYITKIKRNHLNACGIYFYIFYLIINFFLDNISVCFIFKKKYSAYQYTKMNNGAICNICVFVKKKNNIYHVIISGSFISQQFCIYILIGGHGV